MPYALLVDQTPVENGLLPKPVALAAEIRGFVGENLEYGRSAYMCALVHDEVDGRLAQWSHQEREAASTRGSRQKIWAFAATECHVVSIPARWVFPAMSTS